MKLKPIVILEYFLQYLLTLLFLYTGIVKILDFDAWQKKVLAIDFITANRLTFIIYLIPAAEMLISIFFISNIKTLWTALGGFALMALFTGYLFYKIYISDDSLCPCGGIFSQLTLDKHLIVNIVFTIIACMLCVIKYKNQNSKSWQLFKSGS